MNKLITLSYSPFDNEEDEKKLIAFINSSKYVNDWTHPYHGFFVLALNGTLADFSTSIDEYLPVSSRFVAGEISTEEFFARIPQKVFDWMNNQGLTNDDVTPDMLTHQVKGD
jgi:hypothetical protein